jgi:DHA1 family bicyclomycin/chloramphenicol resistance-like MFS transporter
VSRAVLGAVMLITGIAPLATDMYVPGFPAVEHDLSTSAAMVQLTLTTFFIGMAMGQLVGGPVSDARGRRRPLLLALAVLAGASLACAFAPSIGFMLIARAVQGLSGGWAMVIARSIVVDLSAGAGLVRNLNLVAGVSGIAPILGPLMGGVILQIWHWRLSFWVVAVMSAVMILAVLVGVPESLPSTRRHGGGLLALARPIGTVLRHRRFVAFLITFAVSMGVTFAYVATSAFILESMNGVPPIVYSVDFASNAIGLTLATLLSARLAGRVPAHRLITVGLAATTAAGLALLIGALWLGTPLWIAVASFFVLMTAQGFIGPNAGALASAEVPDHPGTGSALLGALQWSMAGVIAPLAGLGGDRTAVPMALIIVILAAIALAAVFDAGRRLVSVNGGDAANLVSASRAQMAAPLAEHAEIRQ